MYFGMPTGCTNADTQHIQKLRESINGQSIDYYTLFEKVVIECEEGKSMVKDILSKHHKLFIENSDSF